METFMQKKHTLLKIQRNTENVYKLWRYSMTAEWQNIENYFRKVID